MHRVGLVAPLAPQTGGVATVAEWLLAHQDEIGVRYDAFDLVRPDDDIGGRWSLEAAMRQLRLLPRFAAWLARAPEIVHVCASCTATGLPRDASLVMLVRASGRRPIAHIHGPYDDSLRRHERRRLVKAIGRVAVATVAPSPSGARLLRSLAVEARWIANPVASPPSTARTNGASPLRLLAVGRMGRGKGSFELIEALAAARATGVDATLDFVGGAERRGDEVALREATRASGVADVVDFSPPVSAARLADRYASADVLCLASGREGLPLAVLEGMSFGLPILATNVGGVPDVVKDGRSGILVAPGDVAALAAGIRALADPERRVQLGAAAQKDVAEFASPDRVAQEWNDLYSSVPRRTACA